MTRAGAGCTKHLKENQINQKRKRLHFWRNTIKESTYLKVNLIRKEQKTMNVGGNYNDN